MKFFIVLIGVVGFLIWGFFWMLDGESVSVLFKEDDTSAVVYVDDRSSVVSSDAVVRAKESIPQRFIIPTHYHIFQTFNNCAPAALSMAFSYYGVQASQETLKEALRPYNNATGNNDDKSTPPQELAAEAKKYGLIPFHRAQGSIDILKQFIAHGMPVVIRTLLEPGKDYAHYRVIKGYDETRKELIQDDSLQGKNIRYSYDDFLDLWKPFNYAYLVLASPDQQSVVEKILGEDRDERAAWQNALQVARGELESNPGDINAVFNISVALYYLGDYVASVKAFEEVEARLPMRTLWYQIEPIQAYFELKNYARVFALSDAIFNANNRAFSELYLLRGKSYEAQGDATQAQEEFKKAVLYNKYITI